MYDFLLQTIFFGSLAVIIYLLARAVPRVNEAGETVHAHGLFDRLLRKLPLSQIDERLNGTLEKLLRRVKVWLLKLDNLVNRRLGKLKNSSKNGDAQKARVDLFDKMTDDKK